MNVEGIPPERLRLIVRAIRAVTPPMDPYGRPEFMRQFVGKISSVLGERATPQEISLVCTLILNGKLDINKVLGHG